MDEFPIPDEILWKILQFTSKTSTPSEFLDVFESVKSNPVLTRILSLWEDELEEQIKQLTYARIIFNDAIFDAIWEENIKSKGMSLDKLATIAKWDVDANFDGLSLACIKAMTWEYLAHWEMTTDKISLLCVYGSKAIIEEIWAEDIATISTEELSKKIFM